MHMNLKIVHTLIILIAGLITCIISLINKFAVQDTLILLLVVIIVFYFIGLIAKTLLKRIIDQVKTSEEVIDEDTYIEESKEEDEVLTSSDE